MPRHPADQSSAHGLPRRAACVSSDIPDRPPPEVLEAMGPAAQAYDRLTAAGRRLHFATDPVTRRVTAQLLDSEGDVVAILPGSMVLHLAGGGTLD